MNTTTTAPAPGRTLTWTPNTDDHSPTAGLLVITQKGTVTAYVVTEFPTGHPGRGFQLQRPAGGEGYAVFCSHHGPEGDSCECADHAYRRRPCKHMAAIRKLLELGRL